MIELYLRLVDRLLTPLLLILSVVLFLRGHDAPGGGFIAALLASAAFTLQIVALGAETVRSRIGRSLQPMIGVGLLLAVSSALIGMVTGQGFFRGVWWTIDFGFIYYKIGTPVIFDLGVFFAVVGVTVSYILGLSETILTPRAHGVAAPHAPAETEVEP